MEQRDLVYILNSNFYIRFGSLTVFAVVCSVNVYRFRWLVPFAVKPSSCLPFTCSVVIPRCVCVVRRVRYVSLFCFFYIWLIMFLMNLICCCVFCCCFYRFAGCGRILRETVTFNIGVYRLKKNEIGLLEIKSTFDPMWKEEKIWSKLIMTN